MKLTKGKLSKIYNKKKQTMKRYKITGKLSTNHNKNTLRNVNHFNLCNKTLRHYKVTNSTI